MTVNAVAIRYNERAGQHSLGLDRATRDALATYARLRWPTNTAKMMAREFGLTIEEGRGIVAGRASSATLDRIWKSPAGGWRVIIPVLGAVIGQGLDDYLDAELEALDREHNLRAARKATLALVESRIGAPGAVDGLGAGSAAHGSSVRPGSDRAGAQNLGGPANRTNEVERRSFAPKSRGRK